MTMNLVNLTPHSLTIRGISIPPSGVVARVGVDQIYSHDLNVGGGISIPVFKNSFGEVVDLPEPEPDTIYLVSAMVLSAVADSRRDVVAPDTGKTAKRDNNGHIVSVTQVIGK